MVPSPVFMNYTFFICGKPIAQPRPRTFSKNGITRTISDSKHSKNWKNAIKAQCPRIPKITVPVEIVLLFSFLRPKSHFKSDGVTLSKTALTKFPTDCCTSKGCGDIDNLAKTVFDAFDSIHIFEDDSQIWSVLAKKQWCYSSQWQGVTVSIRAKADEI